MKKIVLISAVAAAFTAFAGMDMDASGFGEVKNGKKEIVRGEKWYEKAVELTSGEKDAVKAVYTKNFPYRAYNIYEVDSKIKGSGIAFIELQFCNAMGKEIVTKKIASGAAIERFTDFKGKFDPRTEKFTQIPMLVKVIIGVEKNSRITFADLEFDMDDD